MIFLLGGFSILEVGCAFHINTFWVVDARHMHAFELTQEEGVGFLIRNFSILLSLFCFSFNVRKAIVSNPGGEVLQEVSCRASILKHGKVQIMWHIIGVVRHVYSV